MAKKLEVQVADSGEVVATLSGRYKYRWIQNTITKSPQTDPEEREYLKLRAEGLHSMGLLEKELSFNWERVNGRAAAKK